MSNMETIEQGKRIFAGLFEKSIEYFEQNVFENAKKDDEFSINDVHFNFMPDFYGREGIFSMVVRPDNCHVRDFIVSKNDEGYKVFERSSEDKLWEEGKGIVEFNMYAFEDYATIMDRIEGSI